MLAIAATLMACDAGVDQAVDEANNARRGALGHAADRVCAEAAEALPAARGQIDRARRLALNGDETAARRIFDTVARAYVAKSELEARLVLRACQRALG